MNQNEKRCVRYEIVVKRQISIAFKMDHRKLFGVRGLFLGLVMTLSMVDGEEKRDETLRREVVMEEKRRVRVIVREDTPTTGCREMLANLEVRHWTTIRFQK